MSNKGMSSGMKFFPFKLLIIVAILSVLIGFALAVAYEAGYREGATGSRLHRVEVADTFYTRDRIGNDEPTRGLEVTGMRHYLGDREYGEWIYLAKDKPNTITNAGQDFIASWVNNNGSVSWGGAPQVQNSTSASPVYIALSNDVNPASESDAMLPGEITSNGLDRKIASTVTHNKSSNTLTLVATWTATGTQSAQKSGLSPHSGANSVIYFEATFSQASLQANDQLQLTWTIVLSGT